MNMRDQSEIVELNNSLDALYNSLNPSHSLTEIGSITSRTLHAEKIIKHGLNLINCILDESGSLENITTLNELSKASQSLDLANKILQKAKQDSASEEYANQLRSQLSICLKAIGEIEGYEPLSNHVSAQEVNVSAETNLILNLPIVEPPQSVDIDNQFSGENRFVDQLRNTFNLQEIRQICFTLNVPFEDLEGHGVTDKARELYLFMKRRGDISGLVELVKKERPNINWKSS